MKCRRPINRLLMMRKSGLSGPLMQNIGGGACAKSVGAFRDANGPLPGDGFNIIHGADNVIHETDNIIHTQV